MSQENVGTETVQTWFDAFTDDPDTFRGTLHPEVVWFPFEDNHSPSRGIDGAMRIRSHWLESWEDQDIDLEQFVSQGSNVVVTCHVTARGRGSGIEVDTRLHFHFRLRDGKIVHIYEHMDRIEALEAAGFSELAMSQENVELVRRGYDLVSRGDIAGLIGIIGPEFELHENVLAPDAAVYHGPEGLKKWLEASLEAFADFRFEPERFIERGDWVFVPVHAYGRGKRSGAPFDARYVTAFKFQLGKAVFAASYWDLPEALEAVGLSKQDAHADS